MIRIAIDVDDTIANTHQEIVKKALEYDKKYLGGKGFKNKDALYLTEMFYWQLSDTEKFINYLRGLNYYKDVEPIEGANKYISLLYEEGNEIIFITRRNNNFKIRAITEKWLKNNGFKYNRLILGALNKGEICRDLDIDLFIDNDPRNIYDALDYGIDGLLIADIYNKDENEFKKFHSWEDIYYYVKGD